MYHGMFSVLVLVFWETIKELRNHSCVVWLTLKWVVWPDFFGIEFKLHCFGFKSTLGTLSHSLHDRWNCDSNMIKYIRFLLILSMSIDEISLNFCSETLSIWGSQLPQMIWLRLTSVRITSYSLLGQFSFFKSGVAVLISWQYLTVIVFL